MGIESGTKQIYNKNGIVLEETNFENFNFLDYISYENDRIFFTQEKTNLLFYISQNKNIDFNEIESVVTESDFIDSILKIGKMFEQNYLKYMEKEDIFHATSILNKRDKTRMFYKMLSNKDFSYKNLYDFAVASYSEIECSYGYDNLFTGMEICINKDNSIKRDIVNRLDHNKNENKIIAYRGFNNRNREDGISYTLDLEVAKFFANRWGESGKVNEYEIDINDIIAFIDNGESEVISKKATFLKNII